MHPTFLVGSTGHVWGWGMSWIRLSKHHPSLLTGRTVQQPSPGGQGPRPHVQLAPPAAPFFITHSLPQKNDNANFTFSSPPPPLTQIIASHGSLNIAPSLFSRCWLASQPRHFPDAIPAASLLWLSFLLCLTFSPLPDILPLCLPESLVFPASPVQRKVLESRSKA